MVAWSIPPNKTNRKRAKAIQQEEGRFSYDGRLEGGWSKRDNSTDRLRECDRDKGEGFENPENFWTSYVNGPKGKEPAGASLPLRTTWSATKRKVGRDNTELRFIDAKGIAFKSPGLKPCVSSCSKPVRVYGHKNKREEVHSVFVSCLVQFMRFLSVNLV